VPAGACELTRRRSARRISGQEIPAGVGLRSLRCSLGSAIKDVELGVVYRRVAAGILSAVLFLAALVSIGYCMELGGVQTKLCRNPPTHGVRVGSPKSGKDTDSASARIMRNWRQLQSRAPGSRLTTRNKCWQCCRRITCGRSGIREDTCGRAADAVGCRPSGGAVDSPPQAVTSSMCASGSQDFMREAWLRRL
jgi:hypothetical protein